MISASVPGPVVDPSSYVAPEALIIGDVTIGKECSVWPYAVVRGDLSEVRIGDGSSVQEHCQIHGNPGKPTIIGSKVTLGHGSIVHAARIGDCVIIGMNSSVLDDAEIGPGSIVGANALVTSGTKVPEKSLVVGVPAKVVRSGDDSLREAAIRNAEEYIALAAAHKEGRYARYAP